MSYRQFTDEHGRAWEAWEVHPAAVERRVNAERRHSGRLAGNERRHARDVRLIIPRELRHGWLALQGAGGKLRISPIPDGWMLLSDAQLAALIEHTAAPMKKM